jgi:hypothetical protein
VVGRDPEVRNVALTQEREGRLDEPDRGRYEPAVGGAARRAPEVGAEELVRAVKDMDLQADAMVKHPMGGWR